VKAAIFGALYSSRFAYLACFILLLSGTIVAFMSGDQLRWPDEEIYVDIARGLANGQSFLNDKGEISAFRPPGYPFIVSLIFRFNESVLLVKLIGVLVLAITGWLLALLVKSHAPNAHVIAPFLILAYPVQTYVSTILAPQIFGSLFLVSGLLIIFRFPRQSLAAVSAGVIFGLLILTIPSFGLVLACLGLVFAIGRFWVKIYSVRYMLILYLSMAAVVTPWVLRSSFLFNEFVFVSTNSGVNLLFGNSPNTKFNSGVVDITAFEPEKKLSEVELDRHYKQAAVNWIKGHPKEAFYLYLGKLVNYFNFRNEMSTASEVTNTKNVLMFATYYPLLIIALVRLTLWRRYTFSYQEVLLYLIYFGNAFLSAIVYTRIRYRLPFDFLLIAMVSIFIGRIIETRNPKGLK
jgi:hypothetical protein